MIGMRLIMMCIALVSLQAAARAPTTLPGQDARRSGGEEAVNLSETCDGIAMSIANAASEYAFTGQDEKPASLYSSYGYRGLVVLGLPSNDFAGQGPGPEQQMQVVCRFTCSAEFSTFAETNVEKGSADPTDTGLTEAAGRCPKWNSHHCFVDREGRLVEDYLTATSPDSSRLIEAIEAFS